MQLKSKFNFENPNTTKFCPSFEAFQDTPDILTRNLLFSAV